MKVYPTSKQKKISLIKTLNELKPITEYSKDELKEISKKLQLSLSYINGEKPKSYKKNELYNNIENHLKIKSN